MTAGTACAERAASHNGVAVIRASVSGIVGALALFGALTAWADAPAGYIQFKADPGARIEIDGRFAGVTSGRDGLIARNIAPGPRRFAAHREGFVSQFGVVMVEADAVTVEKLEAWQPTIQVEVAGERGVGTLIVETIPADSSIQARRLGWKEKVEKREGPFIARELPAGKHKFTFCTDFKCIDYWVHIPRASVRKLLIDFEPGHIFDVSREFLADWKDASDTCAREHDLAACKLACETDSAIEPARPSSSCSALGGAPPTEDPTVKASRTVVIPRSQDGESGASVASFTPPPACDVDEEGSAFLSVSSRETVEVLLGDQSIGSTPIVHRAIPAGCHQLIAVTQDGHRHPVSIRIEANADRRIKLTF